MVRHKRGRRAWGRAGAQAGAQAGTDECAGGATRGSRGGPRDARGRFRRPHRRPAAARPRPGTHLTRGARGRSGLSLGAPRVCPCPCSAPSIPRLAAPGASPRGLALPGLLQALFGTFSDRCRGHGTNCISSRKVRGQPSTTGCGQPQRATKNNPRSEFPNTTMAFHRAFLLAAMAVAAVVNPAPTHANERGRAVASMRHRICATARCPPLFPAAACCNSWRATGL